MKRYHCTVSADFFCSSLIMSFPLPAVSPSPPAEEQDFMKQESALCAGCSSSLLSSRAAWVLTQSGVPNLRKMGMRGGHTICGVKAPAHQWLCTLCSVVALLRRACAQVAHVLTCPLACSKSVGCYMSERYLAMSCYRLQVCQVV
jgi:hypothetical protein